MNRHKILSDPPETDPEEDKITPQEDDVKHTNEDVGLNHDEADDLSLNKSTNDEVL